MHDRHVHRPRDCSCCSVKGIDEMMAGIVCRILKAHQHVRLDIFLTPHLLLSLCLAVGHIGSRLLQHAEQAGAVHCSLLQQLCLQSQAPIDCPSVPEISVPDTAICPEVAETSCSERSKTIAVLPCFPLG